MAAASGTAGSVVFVSGGTTTVGEISEWSATFNFSVVDTPAFGRLWKTNVPSIADGSGSFSGNWDYGNAGQGSVNTNAWAGSAFTLKLYTNSTAVYSGSARVTSVAPAISQEGKADVSYNFVTHGAWTLT